MSLTKHIPNFFSCLNLLAGSIAIVLVFDRQLHYAAILVVIAAVFDFLDGFAARLFKAYSAIGKELDSLADLVSFGLLPGVLMYSYMVQCVPPWSPVLLGLDLIPFLAFLITVFSAMRLAKFNTDNSQTENFIGLPTPANAIFFISFPILIYYGNPESAMYILMQNLLQNFFFLLLVTLLFSFLLVSPFPMFSLKFNSLAFGSNQLRYTFILFVLFLFIVFRIEALPLIIILYLIVSFVGRKLNLL